MIKGKEELVAGLVREGRRGLVREARRGLVLLAREGIGPMRPTAAELYAALVELQSSAAAYVQGLETENRALREALAEALEVLGRFINEDNGVMKRGRAVLSYAAERPEGPEGRSVLGDRFSPASREASLEKRAETEPDYPSQDKIKRPAVRELVELVGDNIVIRIPLDALLIAAPMAWEKHAGGSLQVYDVQVLAKELIAQLRQEKENGDTLITDMLDAAVVRAVEYGAWGCELEEKS